ncbi:MAG TPA: FUSC family membrane protein [Bacteroidia bacterium]|jgi:uncharacterized membrane protein (TIGR01666 family)
MRQKSFVIPYFFFSQALADGLRITFSILAPVLFFWHIGYFDAGLAISLGAVCVNITDIPGPLRHKRNGLFYACIVVFAASMISGIFHLNIFLTAFIVGLATFLSSMSVIYGIRAATIGSAGLLVLILSMSRETTTMEDILMKSLLILAGAAWYSAISLLLSTMRPYRMPQRALGECIRETAKFLSLKGAFYDPKTNLQVNYKNLLAQQVIVNEKQHDMRELLYKTRQIVKDTNGTGRTLMLTFVDTIDLYEKITASYYNYEAIRKRFENTGVLKKIMYLIKRLSFELNAIGFAIQSNITYKKDALLYAWLLDFKYYTTHIVKLENKEDQIILQRITDNLENVYHRIHELGNYFEENAEDPRRDRPLQPRHFIERQEYSFAIFKDNLTFQSSAFRHAVRVTIACMTGFVIAHFLDLGAHSYWILITIVFIMKPAFSLTKKRNMERLIGTLAGGIIGVAILYFFKDPAIHFAFLLFLMLGTYTFMRLNYIAMVIFTTPYILIMFKLLGSGYWSVIQERLLDTAIGCGIALAAGYVLFPKWEADELEDHIQQVLKANLNYLRNYAMLLSGQHVNDVDYKLARKEVFVSSANLSAAFQRMLSEPRKKQKNSDKVYEFVVLNHVLSSNIAGLAADTSNLKGTCSEEELTLLNQIQLMLFDCMNPAAGYPAPENTFEHTEPIRKDRSTLKEQLEFILRLCNDIYKAKKLIRA